MSAITNGHHNKLYAIVSNDSDDEMDDRIKNSKQSHPTKVTKQHGLISLMMRPSFILFTLCLISSIVFILYWFSDQELVFMVCGITASFMAIFGIYKFRKVLSYKTQLQLTLNSNRKLKIETTKLKNQNDRSYEAIKILKNTKERLQTTNGQNRNNFNSFKKIRRKLEHNENITDDIYHDISSMNQKWRNQNIENEKETLQKIFNRFMTDVVHSDKCHIINERQLDIFEQMLPSSMRIKFSKSAVLNGKHLIKDKHFEQYLNEFATFDFDTIIHKKDKATKSKHAAMQSKHIAFNSTVEVKGYTPSPQCSGRDYSNAYAAKNPIIHNMNNDNMDNQPPSSSSSPPPIIHIPKEPDDVDMKNESEHIHDMEQQKNQRQIGKIDTKEWDRKQKQAAMSGRRATPRRIIKRDNSWMKQKGKKSVHPVHESIDEMAINKLVSQAEITKILTPELDDMGSDDFPETEEQQRKRSSSRGSKVINPDDSWVKFQPAQPVHPVHESVDALALQKMVSGGAIQEMLTPVGEDKEDDADAYEYPPDDHD